MSDRPRDDYNPTVFDQVDVKLAKAIILTAESGQAVEQRWRKETPWFRRTILKALGVQPGDNIVDFGCGIGRLAREVIRFGKCRVTGIDISETMRMHARAYVANPDFTAFSPAEYDAAVQSGRRYDAAYSTYVIQHVADPMMEIERIARGLKPGGRFFLANAVQRWIPTTSGWQQDDCDVFAIIDTLFAAEEEITFPRDIAWRPEVAEQTRIILYRLRN